MLSSSYLTGLTLLGSLAILSPTLTEGSVIPSTIPATKNPLPSKTLEARGFNGMGFASIILAVIDYLGPKNAYDDTVPDKCILTMSTTNGGNCEVIHH